MIVICYALWVLLSEASGSKMIQWLLSTDPVSPELTMTQSIAKKMDRTHLDGLSSQLDQALVLVLPTNLAWTDNYSLYDKLMENSTLRHDVLYSAGGQMDKVGDFNALLEFASKNDGVIDTAYGTPIRVRENGSICIAEYDAEWKLVTSDCAQLRLPPLMFEDGSLYLTDKIILPEAILADLSR